jgi:hypothetical protein
MKAIVFFLTLLASVKIGYQEYLVRSATQEVIVAAYRDRAIAACQRDAKGVQLVAAQSWAKPSSIKVVIGKSNLDVYFWQTDHALWNARFKNPYLFLSASDRPGRIYCEYDIVHGLAKVHRL